MKVLIGLQARTNSTRLPKKIYESIGEKSVLQWVYQTCQQAARLLNAKNIQSEAKVLGPLLDVELKKYCEDQKIEALFPKAPEDDVLFRYVQASKNYTHVIRVTSDCWLHSEELIAEVGMMLKEADYVANTIMRTFPEGLDVQGISTRALQWIDKTQLDQREHPFFDIDQNLKVRNEFEKKFKINILLDPKMSHLLKCTSIDTEEDLQKARNFYEQKLRQTMGRAK